VAKEEGGPQKKHKLEVEREIGLREEESVSRGEY